jgi:alpha-N-arabinofuranosidase
MATSSQHHPIKGNRQIRLFFYSFLLLCRVSAQDGTANVNKEASPVPLVVHVDKPGPAISPSMWGIFFEDINMAADGGLYAELIKNRSFEFNAPLMGWTEHRTAAGDGTLLVLNQSAENANNPRFIRLTHFTDNPYGLSNEGFRGMGIKAGEAYHFSVWARPLIGSGDLALRLELRTPDGETIGAGQMRLPRMFLGRGGPDRSLPSSPGHPSPGGWERDTVSFVATATAPKAQLFVWLEGQGSIDLDMFSLFPQHTWMQRPGGLRADLVQLLADMHPGFIRFPGGCIVEGRDLSNRYQWKKTVGRVEDRTVMVNRWNTEFARRSTPDYYQSFGLGFFEYFQLAEDIGAEPLPILNCGMACQFNTAEVVPLGDLDPYVQDALDLIEFANGPQATKWGALRAAMGHPEPFHLKMMGVGNEQWGPQYIERLRIFSAAIKTRYPGIRLVNSVGPDPSGDKFDFLNDTLRRLHADILDEHYYRKPDWFLQNAARYDHYDRSGPKIFAGEYAAAQSDKPVSPDRNNWECALAEAAFMTGLERNADVVRMASYAPLFAHLDGWQWAPDLIWFDNLRSYGTSNYYVQKLFASNRGSTVVPITGKDQPLTGQDSLYGSSCIDSATREIIIKLVNTSAYPKDIILRPEGIRRLALTAKYTSLSAATPEAANTLENPMAVSPIESTIRCGGKILTQNIGANTFCVIRIKIN